jgi:hypothetical protein
MEDSLLGIEPKPYYSELLLLTSPISVEKAEREIISINSPYIILKLEENMAR